VDEWIGVQLFGGVHHTFDLGRIQKNQYFVSCCINEEWCAIAVLVPVKQVMSTVGSDEGDVASYRHRAAKRFVSQAIECACFMTGIQYGRVGGSILRPPPYFTC
jgi:hypothetical protein